MPIEASWGPSQEYLNANAAWGAEMAQQTYLYQTDYFKHKHDLIVALIDLAITSDNKYLSQAMQVLTKNPNFVIEMNGQMTAGQAASDALFTGLAKLPGDPLRLENRSGGSQSPVKLPSELTSLDYLKERLAFGDADSVLLLDKQCRDFFTKGSSLKDVRNILRTLRESAQYDPKPTSIAGTTGKGSAAIIKLRPAFFANDDNGYGRGNYSWSPTRNQYEELYTSLVPSQFRALTILHEFAHALNLIPEDSFNADPTGQQSTKNDAIIYAKCGKGLNRLPVR